MLTVDIAKPMDITFSQLTVGAAGRVQTCFTSGSKVDLPVPVPVSFNVLLKVDLLNSSVARVGDLAGENVVKE